MNIFKRIYVINLKRRPDRWKSSYNQLISNGFLPENIVRINAVDSHDLYLKNPNYLKTILSENAFLKLNIKKRDSHEQLSVGAVGCALSHISVWRDMVENNIPGAFVFEDDIEFCKGFPEKFELRWRNVPGNWNLVFLGYRNSRRSRRINRYIMKPQKLMLTHSYIIDTRGAEILLNDALPISVQVDAYMCRKFNLIEVFASIPPLVFQKGNRYFETDIQIPLKRFHGLRILFKRMAAGKNIKPDY